MKLTLVALFALAGLLMAQQKLEDLDVQDFQRLLGSTPEDLNRLAKIVDEALAADPGAAFPKFMHGVVTFRRSGDESDRGDFAKAAQLFQAGFAEMEEAAQADPDNIAIRAPRGAMLIAASRSMPPQIGKPVLETGLSDFEHLLKLQQNDGSFDKLSNHQRGELLTGLADGWARQGDEAKGRAYFERIVKEMPGTVYQTRARTWLEGKPEAKAREFFACVGCHVRE